MRCLLGEGKLYSEIRSSIQSQRKAQDVLQDIRQYWSKGKTSGRRYEAGGQMVCEIFYWIPCLKHRVDLYKTVSEINIMIIPDYLSGLYIVREGISHCLCHIKLILQTWDAQSKADIFILVMQNLRFPIDKSICFSGQLRYFNLAKLKKSGGRGSSQGDKSPARAPRFSTNTGEGSASSAQGGRNHSPINIHPPLKPPGKIKTTKTIKTTKEKTKS